MQYKSINAEMLLSSPIFYEVTRSTHLVNMAVIDNFVIIAAPIVF